MLNCVWQRSPTAEEASRALLIASDGRPSPAAAAAAALSGPEGIRRCPRPPPPPPPRLGRGRKTTETVVVVVVVVFSRDKCRMKRLIVASIVVCLKD